MVRTRWAALFLVAIENAQKATAIAMNAHIGNSLSRAQTQRLRKGLF